MTRSKALVSFPECPDRVAPNPLEPARFSRWPCNEVDAVQKGRRFMDHAGDMADHDPVGQPSVEVFARSFPILPVERRNRRGNAMSGI